MQAVLAGVGAAAAGMVLGTAAKMTQKIRPPPALLAVGLIAASGLILARGTGDWWLPLAVTAGSTVFVWRTDYSPLWVLCAGAVIGLLAM